MSTQVRSIDSPARIRVALIIEGGKLKPVWFEQTDRKSSDRIFIKEITYVWSYMHGNAKIINFGVWDGVNSYRLSLNTIDYTWQLGVVESEQLPQGFL